MDNIPEKERRVYCSFPCSGRGHYQGVYGFQTCEECNGKGYYYVTYWKPKNNWVKKPLKNQ